LLRLRESVAGTVSDGYERLTRRPFPRLRPRPLWYEQPLYYKGNPATFIGDGDTVRWPAYTQALDYELEVGVVIARDCTDLTREEALAAVPLRQLDPVPDRALQAGPARAPAQRPGLPLSPVRRRP
jgi:Fumarylacetoacetate (FAA) hydrolase family